MTEDDLIDASGGAKDGARAILRVPGVLMEVAAAPEGITLSEVAARLAIPKASLLRILRTLESGGYVRSELGGYRLGPNSFHLARLIGSIDSTSPLIACVRPELERLARETGETVMLGELSDGRDEMVYTDVIASEAPVRFIVKIGDRRPLYCAASGQAVLAFFPRDEVSHYLENAPFTRFSPLTLGCEELAAQIDTIRRDCFAFDTGGRVEGASGIACPIFDAAARPIAALSVAGPSNRIEAGREAIAAAVCESAKRTSRALGYRDAYPPLAE